MLARAIATTTMDSTTTTPTRSKAKAISVKSFNLNRASNAHTASAAAVATTTAQQPKSTTTTTATRGTAKRDTRTASKQTAMANVSIGQQHHQLPLTLYELLTAAATASAATLTTLPTTTQNGIDSASNGIEQQRTQTPISSVSFVGNFTTSSLRFAIAFEQAPAIAAAAASAAMSFAAQVSPNSSSSTLNYTTLMVGGNLTTTTTSLATSLATNGAAAAAATTTTTTTTAAIIDGGSNFSIASVDSYLTGMAWPRMLCVAIFLFLILVTIIGNTLVILAVLTTRRLRTVTNCFVMNLAITDWLVGTCVMPPAVILYIVGTWRFGWILCDIWISLDVLLCTGSILSLCAISLDRYLAVTQPLTYSKKRRSKRLALFMILIVWITALCITCPPYLGWYEPGRRQEGNVVCRYNQNKGYVVFSAMGSFFIPLAVMLYVYLKIGYVLTSRRQRIVRDANSERTADHDLDCENFLSESEHFHCITPKFPSLKARWGSTVSGGNGSGGGNSANNSKTNTLRCNKCSSSKLCAAPSPLAGHEATAFYELVEISRLSSLIHCTALSCKFGSPCVHAATTTTTTSGLLDRRASTLPMSSLHFSESHASFADACLAAAAAAAANGGGATTTTTMTTTTQHMKCNAAILPSTMQAKKQHHHQHHQPQHAQHHHHHHRVPMRISTTKRDTKTAKTLTMVMGGFIACWLPFFVYYLLIPFLPPAAVIEGLMAFLTWVGWVNCAINPFIYAFYNPDFRIAFWRLTCRPICKQKPPPNHATMFRG